MVEGITDDDIGIAFVVDLVERVDNVVRCFDDVTIKFVEDDVEKVVECTAADDNVTEVVEDND